MAHIPAWKKTYNINKALNMSDAFLILSERYLSGELPWSYDSLKDCTMGIPTQNIVDFWETHKSNIPSGIPGLGKKMKMGIWVESLKKCHLFLGEGDTPSWQAKRACTILEKTPRVTTLLVPYMDEEGIGVKFHALASGPPEFIEWVEANPTSIRSWYSTLGLIGHDNNIVKVQDIEMYWLSQRGSPVMRVPIKKPDGQYTLHWYFMFDSGVAFVANPNTAQINAHEI